MKIIHWKFLGFVIALLGILALSIQPSYIPQGKVEAFKILPSEPEIAKLFSLVNRDRKVNGVAPLKYSLELEQSATYKCNDMVDKDYFSHTSPDGLEVADFVDKYSSYETAAENLGRYFKSVDQLQKAWMDSPKHREAILDARYSEIGLAICGSSNEAAVMHLSS